MSEVRKNQEMERFVGEHRSWSGCDIFPGFGVVVGKFPLV